MKTGRVLGVITILLLSAGVSCKPDSAGPFLKQGWMQEQRQEFYHKSQGTQLIPLSWLLALTQKGGSEPFLADANIAKFRFIPDAKHKFNEHGLPVGFAVTQVPMAEDTSKTVPVVGWTCAACHTGQIVVKSKNDSKGKTIQIDGAPSMQNNLAFVDAMMEALGETIADDNKLEAFVKATMGVAAPGPEQKKGLKKKVEGLIDQLSMKPAVVAAKAKCTDKKMASKYADPNFSPVGNWGFGRIDAIGRASNSLFASMHPCNLEMADGQVSIPKVWNAWKYDWVQWNAFIENPLARNLAQAIAVGANPDLEEPKTRTRTINLKALGWMEDQLQSLNPPHWEDVFGPVDTKLAEEGKALYHKGRPNRPAKGGLCAHCHVPQSHLLKDCDGKAEWKVAMIPIDEVGTDETTVTNYTARLKKPTPNSGLPDPFQPAFALADTTSKVMADGFAVEKILEPEQKRLQRCRTNKWLTTKSYKAPSHEGVWATAPYLHNGSVPNLYLMLSTKDERDRQAKIFCVGHDLTYDPVNVGFVLNNECPDLFKLDTTLRNNGNKGHEFRNAKGCEKREGERGERGVLGCELSDRERKALVEYLKTL